MPDSITSTVATRTEAPGVIVARGSVGDFRVTIMNTYISTDAGRTWKLAELGPKNVAIDLHGELLYSFSATNAFEYTRDYSTWITCTLTFAGKTITLSRFATDIGTLGGDSNSIWFIVKTNTAGAIRDAIVHVDLSDAALPVCGESDIEAFQPYGSLGSSTSLTTAGSSCFLGEQLTLKRKKPGTLCHYNSAVSPALSATSTVCPCSRIDLLCEPCFRPDNTKDGRPCVFDVTNPNCIDYDSAPVPAVCPAGTNYSAPTRKNVGSKCDPNPVSDLLQPRDVPCPISPPVDPSPNPTTPPTTPPPGPIVEPPEAPCTTLTCQPPVYYPTPSTTDSDNDSDEIGLIIGLVVGTIAVAGFLIFYFVAKHPEKFPSWCTNPAPSSSHSTTTVTNEDIVEETHKDSYHHSLDTISDTR